MLSLAKDERAVVEVVGWGEAVAATPEAIRAALLNQRSAKGSPDVTITRSDRYIMEVYRGRAGLALRVMNYDEKNIIRKAWWAAPASYQFGARMRWFETDFRSKSSKIMDFEGAAALMVAFVEGTGVDIPHKWVPEHQ